MTPQEVLTKAAALLEASPSAWTQDHIALDHTREPVRANHRDACSWCALGAISKVQNLPDAPQGFNPASMLLASRLNVASIADWNDHPLRTRAEVIEGLRSAALQTVTK